MDNPNCSKCRHFYITLDERFPRGCKIFGIKGKNMPSIDVKRHTGHHCPVFRSKDKKIMTAFKRDQIVDTLA